MNSNKNLHHDQKANRLKMQQASLQDSEIRERLMAEKLKEVNIMAELEAEEKARQKEIQRIAAEEERIRREEELKRLEELARIAAEEERKRQIKRRAELKRIQDEIKVIGVKIFQDLIDSQVGEVCRGVYTEQQEE